MTTRDFVASVFCVQNNKVLLIHHKKLKMWLPPGGHIDINELPCQAAIREFKEETGIDISLIGEEEKFGVLKKLIQPQHIQLEDIEEGHQHIDLIYFAKLIDSLKWVHTPQLCCDLKPSLRLKNTPELCSDWDFLLQSKI